ncbi:DUF4383 domain-containing protein [Nostoc sp. UCD121]|uniref:DUF4383 domain-containing protein n=1 Tax=unclassified Nostoc TaxID=2593658 RepID=UPI00162A7379|nr:MULTISPECIES: DUF4383 domain-containing protein [unclassified Nostoc]MBC1224013.1 DUF4383 domain-containing protein [Nostoc sp. UCD120]MBC1277893.1 DUF4383 domain-containing protein [Nostoc sp. UCD121]MBC1298864.1 DUF4383 domain-containing protein [Nostoc sp. UCD122]
MENINQAKMIERYIALAIGISYLLLGLAGFVPALVSLPGTSESFVPLDESAGAYSAGFGYIFGAIPTNFLHNIVRCAVGLLGITSYNNTTTARLFNRGFAVSYALLAIIGLLPLGKTFFGLMPLFGANVLLNALAAIAAGYYSVVIPAKVSGVNVSQNLQ